VFVSCGAWTLRELSRFATIRWLVKKASARSTKPVTVAACSSSWSST
jgi:hypothetical protein